MPDAMGNSQEASLLKPSVEKPSIAPTFKDSAADFITKGADTSTHDTLKAIPTISEEEAKLPDATPSSKPITEAEAFDKSIQDKKMAMGESMMRASTPDERAQADAVSDNIHLQTPESPMQRPPSVDGFTPFPTVDTTVTIPEIPTVDTATAVKTALNEIKDAKTTATAPERQLGQATWKNAENDQPVVVKEYIGKDSSGREFVKIEGSETALPLDEITFPQPQMANEKDSSQIMGTMSNDNTQAGKEEQAAMGGRTLSSSEVSTPLSSEEKRTEEVENTKSDTTPKTEVDNSKNEARKNELAPLVLSGKATVEQAKEYRMLMQDPEQRKQELAKQISTGSFTDEQYTEYQNLENRNGDELTSEQQIEQWQQKLESLYLDYINPNLSPAELAKTIAEMDEIANRANGVNQNTIEKQQARDYANNTLNPDTDKDITSRISEKERALQREIKEKIDRLRRLEARLYTTKDRVDALSKRRDKVANELRPVHTRDLENMSDSEREKIYNKYLELNSYRAQLRIARHESTLVSMDRRDTMQEIRRKLGVKHGFGAFLEFGAAKVANAIDEIDMKVDELIDVDTDTNPLQYVRPSK